MNFREKQRKGKRDMNKSRLPRKPSEETREIGGNREYHLRELSCKVRLDMLMTQNLFSVLIIKIFYFKSMENWQS